MRFLGCGCGVVWGAHRRVALNAALFAGHRVTGRWIVANRRANNMGLRRICISHFYGVGGTVVFGDVFTPVDRVEIGIFLPRAEDRRVSRGRRFLARKQTK